ncbi:hypothetical protein IFM89_014324 [Coptis chinensis]|uniref:Uncharacterized protein n=1 Tax=Coptis chinensis TaxID=261450 RepID=A0A835HUW6_9MAGN|nr:hypothetical protein IFM89_014324 [Coptis chinensis]
MAIQTSSRKDSNELNLEPIRPISFLLHLGRIKIPYPLQWGAPTFDAGHAFGMMAAVFVSLIESLGAYKVALRSASATPPPAHVLSRGIGWQGIGILLDGLFGTGTGRLYCVYYGPNPMATHIDYIVEFTVAVPILILTGISDCLPDGEHVVQVYCGQTQAIQQYALELSQCLPPTPETTSLDKSDSGRLWCLFKTQYT